jgi:hypothetical protein
MPVASHWKIYLPVMLASFVAMLPAIFVGEKYGKMKQVFIAAIALLLLVQLGFWQWLQQPFLLIALLLFIALTYWKPASLRWYRGLHRQQPKVPHWASITLCRLSAWHVVVLSAVFCRSTQRPHQSLVYALFLLLSGL